MTDREERGQRVMTALIVVLFAAGLAMRLFSAWACRHMINLDAGVVALMAKHIAEGQPWPAFFYGQAHTGSLEALFSGLFCWWFGVSGFAVCLGTVVISSLLMPIVYRWAREAAGRIAGLVALAFIVIGPSGFFHYNASPRGAYASALTLSALVLWLSTRIAIRWRELREQRRWEWLALGLGSGLAWWNSQLTTPAMLAAVLLILIALGRHAFTGRIAIGLAGFMAGSAPFWLYNIRHDWPSLTFSGTLGRVKPTDAMVWLFTERFPSLMIPHGMNGGWFAIIAGLYLLLAIAALSLGVKAWRTRDHQASWTIAGLFLFILLFTLVFSLSHFSAIATPRYALPFVAPVAVMLGVTTAHFTRAGRMGKLAWLPALFLVAIQWPTLTWALRHEQREGLKAEHVHAFGEVLRAHDIDILYAENIYRSWNFLLREDVVFTDLDRDFYRPNALRAEWADDVAVLNDYGTFSAFLATTGGRAESVTGPGHHLYVQITAPVDGHVPLGVHHLAGIHDARGLDLAPVVTDGRIDTEWNNHRTPEGGTLDITFTEPTTVSGIRLFTPRRDAYPRGWSLHGETEEGATIVLYDQIPQHHFYWSGPRFFWRGHFPRMEIYFEPKRLKRLRILEHPGHHGSFWSIAHLDVFEPGGEQTFSPGESEALVRQLLALGIQRAYADRWLANQIVLRSGGTIASTQHPALFPEVNQTFSSRIALDPQTAIIVPVPEADNTRSRLAVRGIFAAEVTVGNWQLFHFPDRQPIAGADRATGLMWLGWGLLLNDDHYAHELIAEARARLADHPADAAIETLLTEALQLTPRSHEAHVMLTRHLEALSTEPEREARIAALRAFTDPAQPASVAFGRGIEFLGYTLSPREVIAGGSLDIAYFWRVDPAVDASRYAVFLHVTQGNAKFQDDHVLLEKLNPADWTSDHQPVTIRIDRTIHVPADVPSGVPEIRFGLYERASSQRIAPSTTLPVRKRAVMLPYAPPVNVER